MCLALGYPHPDYLDAKLNQRQLYEWLAYDAIEPFGQRRDDISRAVQTYWTRAAWMDKPGTPKDFIPKYSDFDDDQKNEAEVIMDDIRELAMSGL